MLRRTAVRLNEKRAVRLNRENIKQQPIYLSLFLGEEGDKKKGVLS